MRNLNHENPLRIAEVRRILVQKRSNSLAPTLQTYFVISCDLKSIFSGLKYNIGSSKTGKLEKKGGSGYQLRRLEKNIEKGKRSAKTLILSTFINLGVGGG